MHRLNRLIKEEQGPKRRVCKTCGCIMPRSQQGDTCQSCIDKALYRQVKDYILTHDVTEKELSDTFDIPLNKIHQWISEGFIDYRRG